MALDPALERTRRKLRRGPAIKAGTVVLTPVVLEELGAGMTGGACWLLAAKRPVALIVAGHGGRRLIRLDKLDRTGQEQ